MEAYVTTHMHERSTIFKRKKVVTSARTVIYFLNIKILREFLPKKKNYLHFKALYDSIK